jgi:hypothetical protein
MATGLSAQEQVENSEAYETDLYGYGMNHAIPAFHQRQYQRMRNPANIS